MCYCNFFVVFVFELLKVVLRDFKSAFLVLNVATSESSIFTIYFLLSHLLKRYKSLLVFAISSVGALQTQKIYRLGCFDS